jgi:hypothetical protein
MTIVEVLDFLQSTLLQAITFLIFYSLIHSTQSETYIYNRRLHTF